MKYLNESYEVKNVKKVKPISLLVFNGLSPDTCFGVVFTSIHLENITQLATLCFDYVFITLLGLYKIFLFLR